MVGALGGAAGAGFFGAFLTGAAIGGVATIWSGPGAIVGAVVGGVAFALAAGYGGIKLADWATRPRKGATSRPPPTG